MRVVFGVLSLLFVVAIIGILARKQMTAIAPGAAPATATTSPGATMPTPSGTPQQQVQQFQQAVQGTMQQARPATDETK